MTRLVRYAPLGLLAAFAVAPAVARPDDEPSAPKTPVFTKDSPRLAAARVQSQNNLKQIGLAFHNYHDTMGTFPGGFYDASGKKVGLSWRVAVLPYLEQVELYKQFKLDEPWDSENNKKLIAKMPKQYAPPGVDTKGYTFYRSFSGMGTILPPPIPGKAGTPAQGVKLTSITDGTSNTFMCVEAGEAVIWTKPDELAYDEKKPVPKLGGIFETGFNAAFCDGSVRFFKPDIDEKTLRGLITANGGEVIKIP